MLRDIYYVDPAYFQSQAMVNSVIDDLAYTIGVNRLALNVVSSGGTIGRYSGTPVDTAFHFLGSSRQRASSRLFTPVAGVTGHLECPICF
jgi:hypothetical protein